MDNSNKMNIPKSMTTMEILTLINLVFTILTYLSNP